MIYTLPIEYFILRQIYSRSRADLDGISGASLNLPKFDGLEEEIDRRLLSTEVRKIEMGSICFDMGGMYEEGESYLIKVSLTPDFVLEILPQSAYSFDAFKQYYRQKKDYLRVGNLYKIPTRRIGDILVYDVIPEDVYEMIIQTDISRFMDEVDTYLQKMFDRVASEHLAKVTIKREKRSDLN